MQILRNLNVTTGGRRILGVPDVGILAATIASETSTGTNGQGLLYDESINPANAGKQLRIRITSLPSAGNIFVYENGAFDFWDAPAGTYYVGYDWYADDVFGGADTATIVVGAADGAASGVTLTGTSSISTGSASGNVSSAVSGVTLTGTSSISAGAATGESPLSLTLTESAILAIAEAVWARQLPLTAAPSVIYGSTGISVDDIDAISRAVWSKTL